MQADLPLWVPDREILEHSPMAEFIAWCGTRFKASFADYDAFHDWSVSERGDFWTAVWEHCKVIGEPGERALVDGERMLDAVSSRMRGSTLPKICCARRAAVPP